MARFVLVHGAFSGAWIWGPLIDRLTATGHSVEAFDLPGSGDDHTLASEVTLNTYTTRLCEVLTSSAEPAIVVGNSMGGIVTTQGAARCPGGVRALILCDGVHSKGRPESARPDTTAGRGRRSGSGQYHHRRRTPGCHHAGLGLASSVVWLLHSRGRKLGHRSAVPSARRAFRDASIHPARRPRRHQPALRGL
jgi:pimeloyl-ACP methyl ester carboxylesterase